MSVLFFSVLLASFPFPCLRSCDLYRTSKLERERSGRETSAPKDLSLSPSSSAFSSSNILPLLNKSWPLRTHSPSSDLTNYSRWYALFSIVPLSLLARLWHPPWTGLLLFPNVARLCERTLRRVIAAQRAAVGPVGAAAAEYALEFLLARLVPPASALQLEKKGLKLLAERERESVNIRKSRMNEATCPLVKSWKTYFGNEVTNTRVIVDLSRTAANLVVGRGQSCQQD